MRCIGFLELESEYDVGSKAQDESNTYKMNVDVEVWGDMVSGVE